jgi:hypothetical protein
MRELDPAESAERMRWLSGEWPPPDGCAGCEIAEGWPAAAWVLNAMYERADIQGGLTHHELNRQAIAAGLREPAIVNGVNLDEVTVTTGVGLGFAEAPGPPWRRLTWAELGGRDGFGFDAVAGNWPEQRFIPQADWVDPGVMPAATWPLVYPDAQSSWPANILPPAEGSLDESSLLALIEVLSRHTSPEALGDCGFYYGVVVFLSDPMVYAGELRDLPDLVKAQRGSRFTPSNFWPADHSWLVYTAYDLHSTQVAGSASLIDALCEHGDLDTVRC